MDQATCQPEVVSSSDLSRYGFDIHHPFLVLSSHSSYFHSRSPLPPQPHRCHQKPPCARLSTKMPVLYNVPPFHKLTKDYRVQLSYLKASSVRIFSYHPILLDPEREWVLHSNLGFHFHASFLLELQGHITPAFINNSTNAALQWLNLKQSKSASSSVQVAPENGW